MNKKGESDIINIVFIISTVIFIILILVVIYRISYSFGYMEERNKACNKLNMEPYYIQGSDVCVDKNNEAHYVKIDCERVKWREWDCIPRIISVGEIRVQNE